MIDIEIDSQAVLRALGRLEQAAVQRAPLMRDISEIMHTAVKENFEAEGRPRWLGMRPGGRDGRLLQDKGTLKGSISAASDNDHAVVGTDLKYAAIHQFGGKTRPHEIRPRNARALKFGGRYAKKVNHPGSDIPARPFLALTEQDADEIEAAVEDYLRRVLGG
ncbi:phage virion morphogenesis protein [Crenobacter luteus]|uniref:Phage morphogenesis protein n=1 Tax=Crenobacter luteus TaxID=1452487 RepID=A0A161SD38_9NEIS|nr:phage virion morphogenesis protein [Crenobacter luteus]KZE34173.1 hypothetical protein AVW16_06775 [Crenobacter luteus]